MFTTALYQEKAKVNGWHYFLGTATTVGIIFQVGHFFEHLVQFGVWLFGDRTSAYMSPIAMSLTHMMGRALFEAKGMAFQMIAGMEILHLIGNSLFILTILGFRYFRPSKMVRYALYVEAFHLYEHIMLTSTTLFLGKAVGLSTFFGGAALLGGLEFGVGYRVIWHFIMNLIPSALIMLAIKNCTEQ